MRYQLVLYEWHNHTQTATAPIMKGETDIHSWFDRQLWSFCDVQNSLWEQGSAVSTPRKHSNSKYKELQLGLSSVYWTSFIGNKQELFHFTLGCYVSVWHHVASHMPTYLTYPLQWYVHTYKPSLMPRPVRLGMKLLLGMWHITFSTWEGTFRELAPSV